MFVLVMPRRLNLVIIGFEFESTDYGHLQNALGIFGQQSEATFHFFILP